MYTFTVVKLSVFCNARDQFLPIFRQESIEPFQFQGAMKTSFTADRLRMVFVSANVDQQIRFLNKVPITPRLHRRAVIGDQHDPSWKRVAHIYDFPHRHLGIC